MMRKIVTEWLCSMYLAIDSWRSYGGRKEKTLRSYVIRLGHDNMGGQGMTFTRNEQQMRLFKTTTTSERITWEKNGFPNRYVIYVPCSLRFPTLTAWNIHIRDFVFCNFLISPFTPLYLTSRHITSASSLWSLRQSQARCSQMQLIHCPSTLPQSLNRCPLEIWLKEARGV